MKIPKATAATTDVSQKTAARRTKAIQMVREVISGGDHSRQLQLEIKNLPQNDREELLRSIGFNLQVPAGQGLAIKCDVGLPWNKLRTLRK